MAAASKKVRKEREDLYSTSREKSEAVAAQRGRGAGFEWRQRDYSL